MPPLWAQNAPFMGGAFAILSTSQTSFTLLECATALDDDQIVRAGFHTLPGNSRIYIGAAKINVSIKGCNASSVISVILLMNLNKTVSLRHRRCYWSKGTSGNITVHRKDKDSMDHIVHSSMDIHSNIAVDSKGSLGPRAVLRTTPL